ncbi:MAG: hypothetical protein ABIV21_02600, partial [Pyrinomonadaceae bacterium]
MHKFVSRLVLTATLLPAGYWCVGLLSRHPQAAMAAELRPITGAGDRHQQPLIMTESSQDEQRFLRALPRGFQMPGDEAGNLLLREYGSVFVARDGAVPPIKVVFTADEDVRAFQSSTAISTETIGGHRIKLQRPAMTALKAAITEARRYRLSITPRGADSGSRGYDQTVSLWASRVDPGLAHWVAKGRITKADVKRIKSLTPYQQVPEILRLEQSGIYFSKDLSKSIIYSVAPPGTSQHLSMLAFDVAEFDNVRVRAVLAKYG